ncbi:MAG: hypothetical protein D8M59_12010 [Planctomycetes bacterium]|nr:hypothetical protein [Planctomycetota bacterium]NOG53529.1 hypothetical protein [Planctomycetota bacterium]
MSMTLTNHQTAQPRSGQGSAGSAAGSSAARGVGGSGQHPGRGFGGGGPASAMTAIDPIRVLRQYQWVLAASVVLGIVIGVAGHFAWRSWMPVFVANATFKVNDPIRDVMQVGANPGQTGDYIERAQGTVAARLMDPEILRQAIGDPAVRDNTTWIQGFTNAEGRLDIAEALEDLSDRTRAIPMPNSSLVALQVSGRSAGDVKRLNDAIVSVFESEQLTRKNESRQDLSSSYSSLRNELQTQLDGLQSEIEDYVAANQIPPSNFLDPVSQEVQELSSTLTELNQAYAAAAGQVELYQQRINDPSQDYTDEDLASAEADPKVYTLDNTLLQLQATRRAELVGKGPQHRYIKELDRQIQAMQAERDAEFHRVLARNTRVRLEMAQTQADSMALQIEDIEGQLAAKEVRISELSKHQAWLESKKQEKEGLITRIAEIEGSIAATNLYGDSKQTSQVSLWGNALEPDRPEWPKPLISVFLGMLLSFGLTSCFVFLRELTDKRVKGPADVSLISHGRVLGVVPHLSDDPTNPRSIDLISVRAPNGVMAESIRQIRNPLLRAMDRAGHKSLLVVGGQPGAGSSSVLTNLAVSIAKTDRRVLVIDANFRRPGLAELFGVPGIPGLGDILAGEVEAEQGVHVAPDAPGLFVLGAGSTEHRLFERLGTERMAGLLAQFTAAYDMVMIDAPAAVAAGESQALAHLVDASVLVVRALQEDRGLVARLIRQMRESRAEHLGVVLNAARIAAGGYFKRNFKHMASYH